MLEVRRLTMLEALGRLGTVAAVAEEFHVTAPGISMQLAGLERELGVALTERRGRRLVLTPAGVVLAAHGRELADRLSIAELEVDSLRRGDVGTYRVGAFPTAAGAFVADALQALAHDRSALEVRLTTPEPENALADLESGTIDLAVIHSYSNVPRDVPPSVVIRPLVEDPVVIALPADGAPRSSRVDLADLAEEPWIVPQQTLTCFQMVDRACGLAGFRPHIVAETMDFAVQLELVASGVGVALIPTLALRAAPSGVRIAHPAVPIDRHIFTARRASRSRDAGLDQVTSALAAAAGSAASGVALRASERVSASRAPSTAERPAP